MQQAGMLLNLKNQIESQKAAVAQRNAIAEAGGDLNRLLDIQLRQGDMDNAAKTAKILDSQRSANAPKGYGPGTQILGPNQEVLHTVPFAPRPEPQAPNEVRLVDFYNKLPEGDPRKPLIKRFIESKTRPPEPRADPYDKPLTSAEIGHWQNAKGENPPAGATLRHVMSGGYKYVSTAQSNKAAEASGAYATIDRLDELVGQIWPQEGDGLNWRLKAKADFTKGRLEQSNRPLVEFEAFAKGTLAPLIRAVGEKGNLATEDIERALLLIPNTGQGMGLPDTPEVARGKMKQLRQWFDRAQGKEVEPSVDDLLRKYGG